ncbi:MAG: T9SS type A sorting domain-containing protein [Kaistella sp.]
MKQFYLPSKLLPLLFLGISGIYEAQQTIIPAGSNAQSAAGSVSYSVLQIFYESQTTATGKVNPGVQQPYEIFTLATNEYAAQSPISVYPNPVKDFLTVDFNTEKLENSSYQLFDTSGKIIIQGNLKSAKSQISASSIATGMYILRITNAGKLVKTFKIIKKL